jgi:hypothetical protein
MLHVKKFPLRKAGISKYIMPAYVSICFLKHPLLVFVFCGAQSNVSCKKIIKLEIGAGIKASGLQYIDLSMKNDIFTIQ